MVLDIASGVGLVDFTQAMASIEWEQRLRDLPPARCVDCWSPGPVKFVRAVLPSGSTFHGDSEVTGLDAIADALALAGELKELEVRPLCRRCAAKRWRQIEAGDCTFGKCGRVNRRKPPATF
jgi:hypothetical protein